MSKRALKIAIVGGGVSGITAAYYLSKSHKVTLFEKNSKIGGHTNTIEIKERDRIIPVDTGFIVCNPSNYPNFYNFLNDLNVPLRDSDMSFGFYCEKTNLGYTGPAVKEFIKQFANFFKLDFLKMLNEQWKFNKQALSDFREGSIPDISLGEYLSKLNSSEYFINNYIIPLGSAIWSSPDSQIENFPAKTFITFFNNHGMLELNKRPRWQTVVGGSYSYLKSFKESFKGKIKADFSVNSIERKEEGVRLKFLDSSFEDFDKVVIATHADEALRLLKKPNVSELKNLGTWEYSLNDVVLHTDDSVMPKRKNLWASWNYKRSYNSNKKMPVAITYYMNRLQGLKANKNYFVTLNMSSLVDPLKIIYKTTYAHPIYTTNSVLTQDFIRKFSGDNNTFFCGSYMKYGFHEDAVTSALEVCRKLCS